MKSYAIFNLLIMAVGIYGFAAMVNPANSPIAAVAQPTNIQASIGAFLGNLFFVVGVWIFRKFFMGKNWRITLFVTQAFVAICSALAIMIVYDTWGKCQNGWFYMFQNSVPMLIQGIGQVVASLAVVEISPPGLEATIYELLTSATNGCIGLSTTLQTTFGKIFGVDDISYDNFYGPMHEEYVSRMAHATLFTLAVNVGAAAMFMWFLPKNAAMCKEWLDKKGWNTTWAGLLNIAIFVGPFVYANYKILDDVASS